MFIYQLVDPNTGEVRYVGLTRDPKRRLQQYTHRNFGHTLHLRNWLNSIQRCPVLSVLAEVSGTEADVQERYWIAHLRSLGARLLNFTSGGEGGGILPPEAKAKLSELASRRIAAGTHPFNDPAVKARAIAANVKAQTGVPKPWIAEVNRRNGLVRKGTEAARAAGRRAAAHRAPQSTEKCAAISRSLRAYNAAMREGVLA